MDDYNGTHESGYHMELLMDGDYRNYCDDHDGGDLNDGNYNNADNNNDGESSDSDDDNDSDSDDDDDNNKDSNEEFSNLWQLPVKQL